MFSTLAYKTFTILATIKLQSANISVFKRYKFSLFDNQWTLCYTIITFNNPQKKPFENTVGKGENGGNHYFLLFPQCFLPISNRILFSIYIYIFCHLEMLWIWTSLKICCLVELTQNFGNYHTVNDKLSDYFCLQMLRKQCGKWLKYPQFLYFPTMCSKPSLSES